MQSGKESAKLRPCSVIIPVYLHATLFTATELFLLSSGTLKQSSACC